jgi:hypothetical protein
LKYKRRFVKPSFANIKKFLNHSKRTKNEEENQMVKNTCCIKDGQAEEG